MHYAITSESGESWETPEVVTFTTKVARDIFVTDTEACGYAHAASIDGKTARKYLERALRAAYAHAIHLHMAFRLDEIPRAYTDDLVMWYEDLQAWQYDDGGVII